MPNAVHQPINSNRTTSVAPQNLDNPSYGRLTAEDASPPTTSSTQELIRSLGAELASLQTHNDRVSKLVYMGAKLFKGAPEPAVLRAPPPTLQESRSFSLPAPTANDEASRNFFLFQTPCSIEYKLVSGCVASIFLAVHVDKHGVVHVDGTSDSLITKAALALILDAVELQPTNKVLHLDPSDVAHQDTLATLSFMKRDGVATILDHIKSEVRAHSVLTGIQKHHPNRKKNSSNKRVAVLVSGGVDSSVALWKLKSRGYRVEAFYLKVWGVEKADETGNCEWATDVDHAMRVCSSLGVPLHILPFQDLYHERVLGPFIEGTRMGETPNPDVCCNEFIKFGAFLDYATRWGFSHVASGHYAAAVDDLSHADVSATGCSTQVNQGPHRITRLRLCKDLSKDQTYFLSRLTQSQLQRVIFPLSRLLKTEVRYIARTLGFANHDRKDSVGLCFLGKVNVRSFLADRLGRHPGPIVDCETQERIGEHPGLYHFTVGQREGIARYLSSVRDTHRARHVVKKDVATNTLYTSTDYHSAPYVGAGSVRRYFEICDIAWNVPDFLRYTQTAGTRFPASLNVIQGKARQNCD
ncbi:tRNA methyl transferase family protein [Babesia caballi]|uniref:tRNA-5-taurinomethyluridine 2-sulfurtransferase n=1 Tax=Babesia caballi TaxID=5871 RepID=A0AAV4LNM0_BABCB|nr:tRNA methyl transferase family protein [Babesia caballi]